MAEGNGFQVIDLGVDSNAEKFVAAVREHQATVVGMSALLTTTMGYMRTVIGALKAAGLGEIPVCVGGAPVSQVFADEIGATGYAPDAASAVELFRKLIERRASVPAA